MGDSDKKGISVQNERGAYMLMLLQRFRVLLYRYYEGTLQQFWLIRRLIFVLIAIFVIMLLLSLFKDREETVSVMMRTYSMNDWKVIVEIVYGVTTTFAIIVAALWTYYNFTKGRLFSPRASIRLELRSLLLDKGTALLTARATFTNIGKTRFRPVRGTISFTRLVLMESGILETKEIEGGRTDDVIPVETYKGARYYIDPDESHVRQFSVTVDSNIDRVYEVRADLLTASGRCWTCIETFRLGDLLSTGQRT